MKVRQIIAATVIAVSAVSAVSAHAAPNGFCGQWSKLVYTMANARDNGITLRQQQQTVDELNVPGSAKGRMYSVLDAIYDEMDTQPTDFAQRAYNYCMKH